MLSFMAIIDLLSILPFFLPFFINADFRVVRVLRFMRVLRVFKMNRYSRSLLLFRDVILDKKEELITTLFLTFILVLLSSTVMYHIEHEKNPAHFPNIIESFWWSVVTITTVGYGDAVPQTGLGKTVASFIAFFGLIAVAMPTAIISAGFLDKLHEDRQKKENRKHKEFYYCPHCGEKLPTGMVIHENSEHHKHKKTNPDSHTEL
jgi:voltage-gated potassium channel